MNAVPHVERFTLRNRFNFFAVRAKEIRFGKQMTLGSAHGSGLILTRGLRLRLHSQPDGALRIKAPIASGANFEAQLQPKDLLEDGWHHCWQGPFSASGEAGTISGQMFLMVRRLTPLGVVEVARIELFREQSNHVRPDRGNVAKAHSGVDPDPRPDDLELGLLEEQEIEALIDPDQDEEGEAYDDHLP